MIKCDTILDKTRLWENVANYAKKIGTIDHQTMEPKCYNRLSIFLLLRCQHMEPIKIFETLTDSSLKTFALFEPLHTKHQANIGFIR
jgi:hypothetical protein